jgi:hypothetical protein
MGEPETVDNEENVVQLPKRRGRPPKAATADASVAPPKRRGRPPKAKAEGAAEAAPKRRGRPPGSGSAKKMAAPTVQPSASAGLPPPDSLPVSYLLQVDAFLKELKSKLGSDNLAALSKGK